MKQGVINTTILKGLLISVIIGIGVAVAGTSALAVTINNEILNLESSDVAIYIIRLLGAAVGAILFLRTTNEYKIIWSILYGAVYCAVYLSVTALAFHGVFQAVIASALGVISVCAALGMAANMHKNKRVLKKYKMHNR